MHSATSHDLPEGLKPLTIRIPTLASMLDVGLTTAWGLCSDGTIETVKIRNCTAAIYASAERYIEDLRRQKADHQPQLARKGLEQATTASLAARAKRRRSRDGAVAAMRDGASSTARKARGEAATK
jgi:hypothetical protein